MSAAAAHTTSSFAPTSTVRFIGRERELNELLTGLDDAIAGHGRLFLLVGEPGIGKTRLAEEVAAAATQRGTRVLWGRCSEDAGVPPFWPWAQILRRLLESDCADPPSHLLAQIVPELRAVADSASGASSQPSERRFELFDAVERLLRAAALRQPLLLILDDLHAADLPSLLLLQFLARQLYDARLLVIGSYRPADLERVAERAQVMNPISRQGTRMTLAALNEAQVWSLVASALGDAPPAALAASVYALSEGNPLFVGEVVQLLLSERDASGMLPIDARTVRLPHGVREVIRERLQPLSSMCQEVLRVAAVIGRELDATLLRSVSAPAPHALMDCLSEAERAGILLASDFELDRYRFGHELIRSTLYDAIPAGERAQLHHRIGEAMEAAHAGDLGAHAAEIAHHFARAAVLGDAGKAVDYAARAAQQAVRQWAYEEAYDLYAQALRALAQAHSGDGWRRCELLLAQGYAARAAGRTTARAAYSEAATLARALSRDDAGRGAELFAQAALGVADQGLGILQMAADASVVQLLEEAEQQLGPEHARLVVQLRARLAAHLSFPATQARSLALIDEAERQARTLGDEATLAAVLGQRHLVLWRFNVIPGRSELATELLLLAERLGDRELAWQGRAWRVVDRMTIGDAVGVDEDLQLLVERADAIRQPRFRWMAMNFCVTRALWRGHWREAEALAQESWQLGIEIGDALAQAAAPFQLYLVARELGREQDENMARAAVQRFPESPMIRAVLITVLLDLDRRGEAQSEFDQLALGDFASVSRESRLGALALLAEACGRLHDVPRARVLRTLLQPFADYNIMYSGNVCFGSAARYLGELAGVCADWEAAAAHFEVASARNRQMGACAPLAWTQYAAARMWRQRAVGSSESAAFIERARTLLAEARSLAVTLSMVRLQHAVTELAGELDTVAAPERPALEPGRVVAPRPGTFRRDGDYWTIDDGGDLVRIKHILGFAYIAALLQQPRVEVHVLDLAGGSEHESSATARSTEPLLDARSRANYRTRLAEIRSEIEEAQGFNDIGRLERLQAEEGQLKREISRAFGLHGRNRPSGSALERARLNVTRAIKTAIRKLSEADANLGHYFATTIKTGNLCCYTPDPRVCIDWRFDCPEEGASSSRTEKAL